MAEKIITFNFFTVSLVQEETGEIPFEFLRWIRLANNSDDEKMTKDIDRSLKARKEKIVFSDTYRLWAIRLLRLRQDGLPFMVSGLDDAEPITLSSDEYLGEDVNFLYDETSGIIMLQRNRFSLSPKRVEQYLNLVWNEAGETGVLKLNVVTNAINLSTFRRPEYKRFEISVADIGEQLQPNQETDVSKVMRELQNTGAKNIMISLSMGRTKSLLNNTAVNDFIKFVKENRHSVNTAKVKCYNEDEEIEEIDLLEDKKSTTISINNEKDNKKISIAFEVMYVAMMEKYNEVSGSVLSLLNLQRNELIES